MATGNSGALDGVRRIAGKFRDLAVDGGLPGAPLGFRLRGATQSGPPVTGTWKAGDTAPDRNGAFWTCVKAGTGNAAAWQGSLTGLAPSGDATGAKDYANIQGLLNPAGKVFLQPGVFYVSNMLQVKSNSSLAGAGKGVTTIKMASGSWSGVAQVGGINGAGAIITYGNAAASYIAVRDLTVDGNQTGITALPGWATGGMAAGDNVTNSPLHLNSVTNLLIENVEVINPIGYTVYLQSCVNFTIRDCRVISGQVSAQQGWGAPSQQDGIHLDGISYGLVNGNYIDTGATGTNVGDDGIALQSLSGACHDITISGNTIRSDEAAIDLAISGNDIYDVAITGNDIWQTEESGIVCQPFTSSSATAHNIAVTGNVLRSTCVNGNSQRAAIAFVDDSIQPGGTPAAAWEGVTVSGNVIENVTNANAAGIYARYGTDITVAGNTIRNFEGLVGIWIGDNIAATSLPVTQFTVASNTVDVSASSVSGNVGVLLYDSGTGAIMGNTVIGPGANGSDRIGISPTQASNTNLAQVINITNNTMSGWDYGIQEYNAGGNPDFNNYSGNLFTSCTVPASLLGFHSIAVANNGSGCGRPTLSSPFTSGTGTSAQNVTGMSFVLPVGSWETRAFVPMSPHGATASTQKLAWTFNGVASAGAVQWLIAGTLLTGGGGAAITSASAVSATMTGAGLLGTSIGQVTVSTGGTLQLTVTSGTSGDECTIPVGAYIDVQPVVT